MALLFVSCASLVCCCFFCSFACPPTLCCSWDFGAEKKAKKCSNHENWREKASFSSSQKMRHTHRPLHFYIPHEAELSSGERLYICWNAPTLWHSMFYRTKFPFSRYIVCDKSQCGTRHTSFSVVSSLAHLIIIIHSQPPQSQGREPCETMPWSKCTSALTLS